jgi:hypothetical protein
MDAGCGMLLNLEAKSPDVAAQSPASAYGTHDPGLAAEATMKPSPENSPQEVLAGLVERVTYHNDENGFCVLRTKARGSVISSRQQLDVSRTHHRRPQTVENDPKRRSQSTVADPSPRSSFDGVEFQTTRIPISDRCDASPCMSRQRLMV